MHIAKYAKFWKRERDQNKKRWCTYGTSLGAHHISTPRGPEKRGKSLHRLRSPWSARTLHHVRSPSDRSRDPKQSHVRSHISATCHVTHKRSRTGDVKRYVDRHRDICGEYIHICRRNIDICRRYMSSLYIHMSSVSTHMSSVYIHMSSICLNTGQVRYMRCRGRWVMADAMRCRGRWVMADAAPYPSRHTATSWAWDMDQCVTWHIWWVCIIHTHSQHNTHTHLHCRKRGNM